MKQIVSALTKTVFCAALCCVLFLAAAGQTAHAARYDLEKADVPYESDGKSYTLSLYDPESFGQAHPRGEYWIEDESQSAWDAYFDYDEANDVFTIYNNAGPYQRLTFLDFDEILADELVDGRVSDRTLYKKGSDGIFSAYVADIGGTWTLDRYITDALEIFNDEGGDAIAASPVRYTSSVAGNSNQREFTLRKTPKAASAPRGKRYMIANDYDENECVTFSYDPSTGIFAMYDQEDSDEPYAYRKFSSDYSRMENQGTSSRNTSGIFYRSASGVYRSDTVEIYRYITDGLLLFLKDVEK